VLENNRVKPWFTVEGGVNCENEAVLGLKCRILESSVSELCARLNPKYVEEF